MSKPVQKRPDEKDVAALDSQVRRIMPLLTKNLNEVRDLRLQKKIGQLNLGYTITRYGIALDIVQGNLKNRVSPTALFSKASVLTMDIEALAHRSDPAEWGRFYGVWDAWWETFRRAGFVSVDLKNRVPLLPDEKNPPRAKAKLKFKKA